MVGGMEVRSNKFVEQWAAHRENLELYFRFNRRTIPICLTFGVFVPVLTYYGIVAEFKKQDKLEGRSRKFLGD
ncbi:unnamed protein product [Calypogeia fissa]